MEKSLFHTFALSFLHIPYVWGGNSSMVGLDCSGLVCAILKADGSIGLKDDFSAQGLWDKFKTCKVDKPSIGCLVFFGRSDKEINHVGILLDDRLMLEAGGGDSSTKTVLDAKASDACVRIRPYGSRRGVIGFLDLGLVS